MKWNGATECYKFCTIKLIAFGISYSSSFSSHCVTHNRQSKATQSLWLEQNKLCQMIFCQIFIQCSAKREKNHWKWKQKLSAMFIRSIQRENSWHAKHSCLLMQQLNSKIKDIYIHSRRGTYRRVWMLVLVVLWLYNF